MAMGSGADMDDHQLAARLAQAAGRALLALRGDGALTGAALGAAGDRIANTLLVEALAELRPEDAVLSEECVDGPARLAARLAARRVWIVDPLDGTREYGEGRDDWAVHVALAIGGIPAAGAVAVPARDRLYATGGVAPPPTPPVVPPRHPILVVSRTRRPVRTEALAARLGAEVRAMGSAGAKAMAVVASEADLYFHEGGQHEWDNCAPAAVALAAGLHASRADGAPLVYNRADTLVPDLIIGRRDLAEAAIAFLAEDGDGTA